MDLARFIVLQSTRIRCILSKTTFKKHRGGCHYIYGDPCIASSWRLRVVILPIKWISAWSKKIETTHLGSYWPYGLFSIMRIWVPLHLQLQIRLQLIRRGPNSGQFNTENHRGKRVPGAAEV